MPNRATPEGCNGGRSGPLAKMCGYYRTHLANSAKRAGLPYLDEMRI